MKRYEVHWSEYYSVDHLSGDWDNRSEEFKTKKEAIEKARNIRDQPDVHYVRVYKIIDI